MEDNLTIYNQLKSVPNEYLKTIQAGRLKGMSDIKPQWRIQKLTEIFGPCGFGWKIQNLKFSYEKIGDETVCNCYLEFLYKHNGEWSEPIPATGGSNFSTYENKTDWETKEKTKVLYVSDEAQKMAYTDAISVAAKMIGLASDVYMGYGGKYDNQIPSDKQQPINQDSNTPSPEKWLNVMNGKDFTPEWMNVQKGILEGKIKSVDDVRKFYKVSKEVAGKITELLNNKY